MTDQTIACILGNLPLGPGATTRTVPAIVKDRARMANAFAEALKREDPGFDEGRFFALYNEAGQ